MACRSTIRPESAFSSRPCEGGSGGGPNAWIPTMQRFIFSLVTALLVLGLAGYTAGLFTDEVRKEESCAICRASRFSGRRYGFRYEHIEDSPLTTWYRKNIDPRHGLDSAHPHIWQQ